MGKALESQIGRALGVMLGTIAAQAVGGGMAQRDFNTWRKQHQDTVDVPNTALYGEGLSGVGSSSVALPGQYKVDEGAVGELGATLAGNPFGAPFLESGKALYEQSRGREERADKARKARIEDENHELTKQKLEEDTRLKGIDDALRLLEVMFKLGYQPTDAGLPHAVNSMQTGEKLPLSGEVDVPQLNIPGTMFTPAFNLEGGTKTVPYFEKRQQKARKGRMLYDQEGKLWQQWYNELGESWWEPEQAPQGLDSTPLAQRRQIMQQYPTSSARGTAGALTPSQQSIVNGLQGDIQRAQGRIQEINREMNNLGSLSDQVGAMERARGETQSPRAKKKAKLTEERRKLEAVIGKARDRINGYHGQERGAGGDDNLNENNLF